MNVLGPFQFLESGATEACGCGGDYCTPIANGDRIAFQIPADQNCCGEPLLCCADQVECQTISEACFTALGYELGTGLGSSDTWGINGLCIDHDWPLPPSPVAADYIFRVPISITSGTKYRVTFCVSSNDEAMPITPYIGSVDGTPFSGTGEYTTIIEAADTGAGIYVGIKYPAFPTGEGGIHICISCFTLCEAKTWTATLVDSNLSEITTLTLTDLDNGNIFANLSINTAETGTGCFQVKLTNDCDETVLYSQCLNFRTSFECSLLFKWRNDSNAFGYDYTTDPAWYNYLRVAGRIKHPSYPTEKGVFRLSDNTNVLTNAVVQKIYKVALSTPGVPEFIHDNIAIALVHSEFLIDGTQYVVGEGDYEPGWRNSNNLSVSMFEVLAQDFDGVNTSCG